MMSRDDAAFRRRKCSGGGLVLDVLRFQVVVNQRDSFVKGVLPMRAVQNKANCRRPRKNSASTANY